MSLPDTEDFRNLLNSINLSEHTGQLKIIEGPPQGAHDRSAKFGEDIYLNVDQDSKIGLSALIQKLMKSWSGTEHPVTDQLAHLVISIYSTLKFGYQDSYALFNKVLNSLVSVDVSHFIIYPVFADIENPTQEFAGFRFGKFDNFSLQYRCKRARSDYFDLYKKGLSGRQAIESPVFKRVIINFIDLYMLAPKKSKIPAQLFQYVLLQYYETLSEHYLEHMWQFLDDSQMVGAVVGHEIFNVPNLKRAFGTNIVSIFLNQTSNSWDGYVVPYQYIPTYKMALGKSLVLNSLKNYQLGIDFPLSPTLSQVSRYAVSAKRHAFQGLFPDALLNFTIALEMLFSDKGQTSQTISRRLAVLISDQNHESYKRNKRKVLELYDFRSKYVHAGIQPKRQSVEEMEDIFKTLMPILIRLERRQVFTPDHFLHWNQMLDWTAFGYEANQIPNDIVLREIGLLE